MIDGLIFIGKCLLTTYCTMFVVYFLFWMGLVVKNHKIEILELYKNKSIYVKWFRYIIESITGSALTALAWPLMFTVMTLDSIERMKRPY